LLHLVGDLFELYDDARTCKPLNLITLLGKFFVVFDSSSRCRCGILNWAMTT